MPELKSESQRFSLGETAEGTPLQPLEVIKNFDYSDDLARYTPPFASEEEANGFLSGSESTVLCTTVDGEPVYSRSFVQCSGALVKNRDTGLISVIHQSSWSTAASIILSVQKHNPLDVITFHGPMGKMRIETLESYHQKNAKGYFSSFAGIDRKQYYPADPQTEHLKHIFLDYSRIKGITTQEMEELFQQSMASQTTGELNWIGEVVLPVKRPDFNRMSMLYRPKENFIWIYESGTDQLFKYAGFPK